MYTPKLSFFNRIYTRIYTRKHADAADSRSHARTYPVVSHRAEAAASSLHGLPTPCQISERLLIRRPFVKSRRIEVRAVRPYQCLDLWIDLHLIEQIEIPQGAIQLAGENRPKIDRLFGTVVKMNTESVRSDDLKGPYTINRVTQ